MPPSSVSMGAHAIETSPIPSLSRWIVDGKSSVVAVFGIWRTVRFRMTIPVAVCSTGLGRVWITPSTAAPRQAPTCVWPSGCTTKMPNCSVANSFSQLSRIFSKTGAVSFIELLMTRNTSDVAVCCASASLVSLNSRVFWIAITAWSAKVCINWICCGANVPGSLRVIVMTPTGPFSPFMGTSRTLRKPRVRAVALAAEGTRNSISISGTWATSPPRTNSKSG